MSRPVSVSTGAARMARLSDRDTRESYTPRMLRRSDSDPDVGAAGVCAAVSNPPCPVLATGLADAAAPAVAAAAFLAFSAAIFARRSSAAFAAASAASSTGGGFSRHSPSKSVQLPSPFSSMLIRPSASKPSAAEPMDCRFFDTILYATFAAVESTGSFASLNSHPMPVMSYSEVSASMPVRIELSLLLMTCIVAIASSKVMPSFFIGRERGRGDVFEPDLLVSALGLEELHERVAHGASAVVQVLELPVIGLVVALAVAGRGRARRRRDASTHARLLVGLSRSRDETARDPRRGGAARADGVGTRERAGPRRERGVRRMTPSRSSDARSRCPRVRSRARDRLAAGPGRAHVFCGAETWPRSDRPCHHTVELRNDGLFRVDWRDARRAAFHFIGARIVAFF